MSRCCAAKLSGVVKLQACTCASHALAGSPCGRALISAWLCVQDQLHSSTNAEPDRVPPGRLPPGCSPPHQGELAGRCALCKVCLRTHQGSGGRLVAPSGGVCIRLGRARDLHAGLVSCQSHPREAPMWADTLRAKRRSTAHVELLHSCPMSNVCRSLRQCF